MKLILKDPFRVFFPIGILLTFVGAFFWPLKIYGWGFAEHSSQTHIYLHIYGFLLAFVIGFLTTALPRLSETSFLRLHEFLVLFIAFCFLISSIFLQYHAVALIDFAVIVLFLAWFCWNRFANRKRDLPPTFVFLAFALVSALCGVFIQISILLDWGIFSPGSFLLGKNLIYQGFLLFLFLGVGGFLIRSILGMNPRQSAYNKNFRRVLAVGILVSFFIESEWSSQLGLGLRALLISFEVLTQIQFLKKTSTGKLGFRSLQTALLMLLIGSWSEVFAPESYGIDLRHMTYAGGFSLGLFAISTRVIFSHCGFSEKLQGSYRPYSVAFSLFFLAVATRVVVIFLPNSYENHLAYASFAWCLGLVIWFLYVLAKVFRKPSTL